MQQPLTTNTMTDRDGRPYTVRLPARDPVSIHPTGESLAGTYGFVRPGHDTCRGRHRGVRETPAAAEVDVWRAWTPLATETDRPTDRRMDDNIRRQEGRSLGPPGHCMPGGRLWSKLGNDP